MKPNKIFKSLSYFFILICNICFPLGSSIKAQDHRINLSPEQFLENIFMYEEKEAWDYQNNPLRLGSSFEKSIKYLPLSGEVREKIWGDSYWPNNKGGIAFRWSNQSVDEEENKPFTYQLLNKEEVEMMSEEELASLSPAEKYDIYMGRYDFPTVKIEKLRNDPTHPDWFGLCHGWAAASINFKREPRPVTIESPDNGLKIPFGASDIKALLTFYQGYVDRPRTLFLGTRCEIDFRTNPLEINNRECLDTNAGSFHVILSNFIGMYKTPFIADMTRDAEVWNFPVIHYEAKIINRRHGSSPGAAPGTKKEIEFKTLIKYSIETQPAWDGIGFLTDKKFLHYRLEIDENENILGGTWLGFDRPDFLWIQDKPQFQGYYKNIEIIYKKSISL